MLRGRGHLPHRPSRCFPAARSQLHRLWTRRELEKTKEPRRNHVRVHRRRFEYRTENRLIQNWKIITRFSTEREREIYFFQEEGEEVQPLFSKRSSGFTWGWVLIRVDSSTWVRVTGHLERRRNGLGSWQPVPPSPTPKIDGDRAEGQSSIRERGESLKFLPLNTHCLLNTLKLDNRSFLGCCASRWWRNWGGEKISWKLKELSLLLSIVRTWPSFRKKDRLW